jgi:hypothetical protein
LPQPRIAKPENVIADASSLGLGCRENEKSEQRGL